MNNISIYDISTGFSRFVKSVITEKEAKDYCKKNNRGGLINFMWLYEND